MMVSFCGIAHYIKWVAIDSTSAKATVTYNDVSGSVVFHFNEQGRLKSCTADSYKESGKMAD